MGTFSVEFEQGLLDKVDELAKKKLELERQLQNRLDKRQGFKRRAWHHRNNARQLDKSRLKSLSVTV